MSALSQLLDVVRGGLYLVFPKTCWACARFLTLTDNDFCSTCRVGLATDAHAACPRCSSTVGAFAATSDGCTHCRNKNLGFDRAFRLGRYDGPLREIVLRMKHVAEEGLADAMGNLWAEHSTSRWRDLSPTVVIPVPLHWTHHVARGYNQSESLARPLARHLKIPCWPGWLRRTRRTQQQTRQPNPAARQENVRGAFSVRSNRDLQGQTVLLVDDVMTTGATAGEAARALRKAGAAAIIVAVLARTVH